MNGREHWLEADRLLGLIANYQGNWSPDVTLTFVTRALAHAALAGAARPYGLHVPPRTPEIEGAS